MALFGAGSDESLQIVIRARDEASKVFDNVEKRLGETSRRMRDIGKKMTVAVSGSLVAGATLAAKSAIEYESAFAGVRKTVNATEDEFAKLSKGIREMAKQMPISANELAGIGEVAGQLGVGVNDLEKFIDTVAKIGVTTNLSGEEAATAFARIANIMEEPLSNVDKMASSVVHLGNNMATTEAEIVEFANRIAGAGKIAGLNTDALFGIGAAMSSVGVQAEAGGTAVQKVLIQMNTAALVGGEALDIFAETAGLTSDEFKEAWEKDAAGAFTDFVAGLGEKGDEAIQVLSDLGLEDQRLIRSFLSLANAGDLLTDAMGGANVAFVENTALTEEAQKRFETTESKLKILKNRFNDLMMTIGDALRPVIEILIKLFDWLIEKIQTLADKFNNADPKVKKIVAVFIGLVAIAGPLLLMLGGFLAILPMVAAGFALLFSPVTLIVLAIAGLVLVILNLKKDMEALAMNLIGHWENIKQRWEQAVFEIGDGLNIMVDEFKQSIENIKQWWSDGWEAVKNAVKTILDKIKEIISGSFDWIRDKISGLFSQFDKIRNKANEVKSSVKSAFSNIGSNVRQTLGFEHGGMVPGPVGKAVPIIAHGGEEIIPANSTRKGGGTTIVTNINNPSVRSEGDLDLIRKQVEDAFRSVILNNKIELA